MVDYYYLNSDLYISAPDLYRLQSELHSIPSPFSSQLIAVRLTFNATKALMGGYADVLKSVSWVYLHLSMGRN